MKDKSLAVSKRDRQLLSILLAVVLLFLLYLLLAGPALDESIVIKENIAMAENQLASMQSTIDQAPQLKSEIATKREELDQRYQLFHYKINEARFLNQIDGIMTATNFPANSISHAGRFVGNVAVAESAYQPNTYPLLDFAQKLNPALGGGEGPEAAPVEETQPVDASLANTVEQMDITIGFSNIGYPQVYGFLQALEGLERSYLVADISMGQGQATTGLQGQILLKAISLPKINEEEANDLLFEPTIPQGKTTPF